MSQKVAVALILAGTCGVVAAVWLLAGYPWAIGVAGVLALIAGGLLFDPDPPRSPTSPLQAGKRGNR